MDVRSLAPPHLEALRRLTDVAARQDGVLCRADVLRAGASGQLPRTMVARGEWLPLLRGTVLAEPWRTGVALQRSWARGASLLLPGAVVAERTAAVLHGLPTGPRDGRVHVASGREVQVGSRPLAVHRWDVPPEHLVDLSGLTVTSRVRTTADLSLALDRPDALALLDALARSDGAEALAEARALAAGRRGSPAVADLWGLADARAETPLESRARLRCIDGGLAPDDLQVEVVDDDGELLARSDMVFRHRRPSRPGLLLLEADGQEPHSAPEPLFRDRSRQNRLVALGHDVVRCTWRDTLSRGAVPAMVRAAL
ncbi:hypothetical protein [Pseudokineococcus sp. 1T1Z-3]|uniref:hypothetical protein n=1 Tax=Pseudokineococcus sp. 1T1Z-3 TaxID=3132745 RepID=UPI0030A56692